MSRTAIILPEMANDNVNVSLINITTFSDTSVIQCTKVLHSSTDVFIY